MKLRFAVAAVLATAVTALGLITGTPSAQAATYCGSKTKTWYLSDGSVSLRIMTIKTTLEVCTNNSSIVSTAETTTHSFTDPGIAFGWIGDYGPPVRTSFSSCCSSHYTANGYLKDCASHWTAVLCSRAENFYVNSVVSMEPIVVVSPVGSLQAKVGSRVFTWSFTPHNVAPAAVHFNTTI